ncbi:peroxiredoxin [bacterium]|nr:peroxiredoxin [bacterium]
MDSPKMPLIGDAAPEFTAMTTNGPINFPSDYAGHWVVLFSHPSDFTPVCTSEFMAFQAMADELESLNTKLVGLSVGSVSSHLAWIDAIRDIKWREWENMEITFPVIDDIGMRVAKLYGMIHPNASGTHAVRAVFIIDPAGIIRAILYYPASTGRSFDEIKRMVIALQTTDAFKVSTPADWLPGDDVLVGAPQTSDDMRRVMQSMSRPDKNRDVQAWFLTFRTLPAGDIESKLVRGAKTAKPAPAKKKTKK